MRYLKQIYFEMRHQKMMTWVSIGGTAISIFLVMIFYLVDQLNTITVAPESNRDRILIGQNMHIKEGEYDRSSALNHKLAMKLYHNLDGIEMESLISAWADTQHIGIPGEDITKASFRTVDQNFWKIYDFNFIDGKPFDEEDVNSGVNKIIISRSIARKLFNEDKVAGHELLMGMQLYTIAGVIDDTSKILLVTGIDIFGVYQPEELNNQSNYDESFGETQMVLLLKKGITKEYIKGQVEERYKQLQAEISKKGAEVFYHEQPYDTATISKGEYGANTSPENDDTVKWAIYAIMILLPAINLSSMTRSRLRHRISEIGVRRAFGASKASILFQILTENFIITLLGGIVGLILSICCMAWFANFFMTGTNDMMSDLRDRDILPTLEMLITWPAFFYSLLFCLLLNLISAFMPSWKASRLSPANAISKT